MNSIIFSVFCICVCLVGLNAVPATPTATPTKPAATEESFFKRMWHKVTSVFGSSDTTPNTDTEENNTSNMNTSTPKSLSLKEKIVNGFNSIFGVEEFNPPKDSYFVDRLWLLFKHCFLNVKNVAKIFSK
uniref:SJCHGC06635 protein n=1 Tax=Schistosoma japonicum TaxID=6182 RepID=Q5DGF9_SCHJA|nr:SJCHGC06635 protein [Schistosoma japonicum]